jgi:hypothetical protein
VPFGAYAYSSCYAKAWTPWGWRWQWVCY